MKWTYIAHYCWNLILGKTDRIFSFLSIFSIIITITIFISLSGLLYSFKGYTEKILDNLPLNIEVFKTKNTLQSDISGLEKKILIAKKEYKENKKNINNQEKKQSAEKTINSSLVKITKVAKRIPTFLSFYNNNGKVILAKKLPKGTTLRPEIDGISFINISQKNIKLLDKKELNSRFDEAGIIVSFRFLKKLGYLPKTAIVNDAQTWEEKTIPKKIYIQVTDNNVTPAIQVKLPVFIVGVVENLPRAAYIITEDFYNLLSNWHYDFQYLLTDRSKESLIKMQENIRRSHYVFTEDEMIWFEDNAIEEIEDYAVENNLEIYQDSWQIDDILEERLVIISFNESFLSEEILEKIDKKIRSYEELKNIPKMHLTNEMPELKTWDEYSKLQMKRQYMQATVYIANRKEIREVLDCLRNLGLFASSPLEASLNTFERQENFYIGATLIIFSLIVFLSGIVLFSTFYTSVQRKKKQIGLLKAIGASNSLVTTLFMIESSLITIVSTPFGILLGNQTGIFAGNWINNVAKFEGSGIQFALPKEYIFVIIGSIFIFSWFAIIIPIRIASKIEPAEAVHS